MEFIPTDDYNEVTLERGLDRLLTCASDKLFSDGLDADEFIYFDDHKGFCYKDGCLLGQHVDEVVETMHRMGWCFYHKFFVHK